MSAELLAQKRAALGSPDGEQAAGTSSTEHSQAVIVGVAAPEGSASEKTGGSLTPGPSDSAAAADSTSAAAGAADLHRATGDSTPSAPGVGFREQQADVQGKDASAPSSALALQRLSLTFKHGALFHTSSSGCVKTNPHCPCMQSALHVPELNLSWLGAVWYSVDLPKGRDALRAPAHEQSPGSPQLYLLNVRCMCEQLHIWTCRNARVAEPVVQQHGVDTGCLPQDVSGAFRPGVLTALVGASGAGKTTLMVRSHALPVQAVPSSSASQTLTDGVNVRW